jgi:hypothetical protein
VNARKGRNTGVADIFLFSVGLFEGETILWVARRIENLQQLLNKECRDFVEQMHNNFKKIN